MGGALDHHRGDSLGYTRAGGHGAMLQVAETLHCGASSVRMAQSVATFAANFRDSLDLGPCREGCSDFRDPEEFIDGGLAIWDCEDSLLKEGDTDLCGHGPICDCNEVVSGGHVI